MSSVHNDLATWGAKAKASGQETIVITADLAIEAADIMVAQGTRIMELEHIIRMGKKS